MVSGAALASGVVDESADGATTNVGSGEAAGGSKAAPASANNAAYVEMVAVPALVQAVVSAYIEVRLKLVADAYRVGTAAQRAAVDAALGVI